MVGLGRGERFWDAGMGNYQMDVYTAGGSNGRTFVTIKFLGAEIGREDGALSHGPYAREGLDKVADGQAKHLTSWD